MARFGHIPPNHAVGKLVGCGSVAYASTGGGAGGVIIVPDNVAVGELCVTACRNTRASIMGDVYVYIESSGSV